MTEMAAREHRDLVLQTPPAPEPSGLACLVIVARRHGVHLSVSQLIHDHILSAASISSSDILRCANAQGLKAKSINLNWKGLRELAKVLPAIVTLKNGNSLVLLRIDGHPDDSRLLLQDPERRGRCATNHRSVAVRGSMDRRDHPRQARL